MDRISLTHESHLSKKAAEKKHLLQSDPKSRRDIDDFYPDMQRIESDIHDQVMKHLDCDFSVYTSADVERALSKPSLTIEDLKALLSPAAEGYTEQMANLAREKTSRYFGNSVYIFTPLYIANHCNNYCVYCGFNRYSPVKRMKLTIEQIEHEMQVISKSGMEEILILTGEDQDRSPVDYICKACTLAKKYFRTVAVEVYPMNVSDYRRLHECGVDYVTVFQETYDKEKYEKYHLSGRKRIWRYRFDAQERALMAGMTGVSFSALFGLSDHRYDALATALHAYFLQRKYPHAEISLSCPRIRPSIDSGYTVENAISESELCRILCAYRIFLPFAGITVSSRESEKFRNGIVKICASKVSAGVSTGIGDHESKYESNVSTDTEQFEINDGRSLEKMKNDMTECGLQPVLNDHIYISTEDKNEA